MGGDDRGGKSYQLQAFMRGSNLHPVWDSGLIKALQQENGVIVKGLLIKPMPNQTAFSADAAAEESCRVVSMPGFYPDRFVTPAYVESFTLLMLYQLALAGTRLSLILNSMFH